jgi:hypothetical protein
VVQPAAAVVIDTPIVGAEVSERADARRMSRFSFGDFLRWINLDNISNFDDDELSANCPYPKARSL